MEYGRFAKFSDEDLRRILNDGFSGYSNEELAEARRELESRATPIKAVRHCGQCGAELEGSQNFCQKCGFKLSEAAPSQIKATGGLKVWLWIVIVVNIILSCILLYQGILLIQYGIDLGVIVLISLIMEPVLIFGAFRLLNGFKKGFYIICAVVIISFCMNLLLYEISATTFTSLLSILILWLFARKQWKNFR